MPDDKHAPRELKVTDKRIFHSDGQIRDEFKNDITAAVPTVEPIGAPEPAPPAEPPAAAPAKPQEERRRSMADRATNPATPFTNFIEPLIAQGYMSLGMLKNPYQPQTKTDPAAARQMIEILTLLREKTAGNLTADEEDFLEAHLGELKLAYVQLTKTI